MAQHSNYTRSKKPPVISETVRKTVEPPVEENEAEEIIHTRTVGGRTTQIPTHVLHEGAESDDEEEEMSDNRSGRSGVESDRSSEWIESRSKATSSSEPSSLRRRSSQEDRGMPRLTDATNSPHSFDQPPLRGGKLRVVPRVGSDPKPTSKVTDPDEVAARSAQLVEKLQRFIQEREDVLRTPRNEPRICGDRRKPREAVSMDGGRHGPVAFHTFETALVDSGIQGRHFLDSSTVCKRVQSAVARCWNLARGCLVETLSSQRAHQLRI